MLAPRACATTWLLPRLGTVEVTDRTVLYTLALGAAAGIACGIVPALRNRLASLTWLKDASRTATRIRHRGRAGLVVAQSALALLLLVGSGLLMRSFISLSNVDPGYVTEDIFTFQMAPEQPGLDSDVAWANFHLDTMARLRGLPGVEAVGIVENFPLNESTQTASFSVDPAESNGPEGEQLLQVTAAAGDYFEAMGIDVLRGRPFTDGEQTDNPGHVIVSRSTAERLWPGDDAVGKALVINDFGFRETVIGVVEDVRQTDIRDETGPNIYIPLVAEEPRWSFSTPAYVLRTSRSDSIAPDVRTLVREIAPEAPVYRVFTIEHLVADSMATLSFTTMALGLAAGLSLFLGMLGLYGVLSSAVVERTRELGIRLALGANPEGVRRMVVRQGLKLVVWAIRLCTLGALAICLVIVTLFVGELVKSNIAVAVAALFITAMLLIISGLVLFLREVGIATGRMRIGMEAALSNAAPAEPDSGDRA